MSNQIDGFSMNIEQTNLDKLRSVFPECVSEGKLDIDKLLSLCGEYIDNDFEKYKFEWKGKADCLRLAQKRSTGTLRPCPEESVDWDTTQNLYIEGDNLEVLKLLQTAYYRKVKMIFCFAPIPSRATRVKIKSVFTWLESLTGRSPPSFLRKKQAIRST